MSRVERHPDGTTVFICTRGDTRKTESEQLTDWVVGEAIKQRRCARCMSKDHLTDGCEALPMVGAQAVAILMGMVQG